MAQCKAWRSAEVNRAVPFRQATQEVVSRCPETTPAEFQAAVQAAKDAFPAWRRTPLPTRQRVMFKLQQLIRSNMVLAWHRGCSPVSAVACIAGTGFVQQCPFRDWSGSVSTAWALE